MSTEAPVEPVTPVEDPEVEPEGAKPDEPLKEPGLAALKAERERANAAEKAVKDALAKVREFEDRDKTESQKQQEALEQAQRELAELTVAKTRAEVANTKQIPTELLAGPASGSAEDLESFADALIAFRGEQKQAPSSSAIGRANTTTTTGSTADQFASQMEAAGF